MEKDVIEKVLGVNIKVLTDKGEEKMLSLTDFLNPKGDKSTMSIDRDMNRNPQCKIDLHLECEDFSWRIY